MKPGPGKIRVAFVTTHPIQYHSGWFRSLAANSLLDLDVLYCHHSVPVDQANAGFGVPFSWDVPLLDGYKHRFLTNVSSHPSTRNFSGLDTPQLRTLLSRDHYDAVVVNGWHYKSAWQAIRACWNSQVPVLVRSDSHLHTARHPLKRLLKSAPYRWFIRKLDGCLAVGQWSSDYFRHYGAPPDRVFVVPHCIDESFATNSVALSPRRSEFRTAWGFSDTQTVFLFAGKFIEKKRPGDFVRALQQAHSRNPAIAGLMVGDGPLRHECEDFVERLHLPVTFAGFLNQSQIVSGYVAADALVLPSNGEETWGLVINEAMTCGRPCLVSDRVGCGPDLVLSGKTGMLFPLGDVNALSAKMIECTAHPARLTTMGRHAQLRMADYSVAVATDRLTTAVSQVLAWA